VTVASLAPRGPAAAALAGLALATLAAVAHADVATLVSARDNTLYESTTGALSNGAGVSMLSGRTNQPSNSRRRAVVHFNVAGAIPAGATIQSVQLRLTCDQASSSSPQTTALHRVLADWGEGASDAGAAAGAGAPSATGDATWKHRFFPTTTWTKLGGDFSATVSAAIGVSGPGDWTWGSTPQLVADVQAFLDAPATNFGWLVQGNEAAAATATRFDTREALDAALVPTLTVVYTPPATPTRPASWGGVKATYR